MNLSIIFLSLWALALGIVYSHPQMLRWVATKLQQLTAWVGLHLRARAVAIEARKLAYDAFVAQQQGVV